VLRNKQRQDEKLKMMQDTLKKGLVRDLFSTPLCPSNYDFSPVMMIDI
jgi:hypothetical protein